MAENGLCWECKEKVINKFSENNNIEGFWMDIFHCHHEPKERAKCWWCESWERVRGQWMDFYSNPLPNFCPKCGTKLE